MKTKKVFVHECSVSGLWICPWTEEDMKLTGPELYEMHCGVSPDLARERGEDLWFERHGWCSSSPDGEYSAGVVMTLKCLFEELREYTDTLEDLLNFPQEVWSVPEWEPAMRELWEEESRPEGQY